VPVADRAHAGEVAGQGGHAAERGADHRLRHEGDHGVRAKPEKLGFEFGEQAGHVVGVGLVVGAVAVGVAGRDVVEVGAQHRRVQRAPHGVAAGRQRAERVAVIALPARDDMHALRLPGLDEMLSRQLQRRLAALRPGGAEPGMREAARRVADQQIRQALGAFAGIERGMGVGQLVQLCPHGRQHPGMAVAKAGNRGTAGAVDHRAAIGLVQKHALAADGDGRVLMQAAVDQSRHAAQCAGLRRQPEGPP